MCFPLLTNATALKEHFYVLFVVMPPMHLCPFACIPSLQKFLMGLMIHMADKSREYVTLTIHIQSKKIELRFCQTKSLHFREKAKVLNWKPEPEFVNI